METMPPLRELEAADVFNETVIDRLPLGVVVLDRHGMVVKYNRFEEQLARRRREDVIGRSFFHDVARCTDVPDIAGRFAEHVATNTLALDLEFAFALPFLPQPRDVRLLLQSFVVRGEPYGVVLIEDITARREAERERERLLSILVHDLNNPLSGILGYSALLRQGAFGSPLEPRQHGAAEIIHDSALRMRELIRGTLEDLRGAPRQFQSVNLHALVLSAIGNQLALARARRLRIFYNGEVDRVEFPTQAIVVRGIVDRLDSLVRNLLSNAVKYAETRVEIRLEQEGSHAVLEVEDDGPGIPEEGRERIFEKGYQAPGSRPGEGIGLYSVQRAVELHHGEVRCITELGRGTTFRVVLPAA